MENVCFQARHPFSGSIGEDSTGNEVYGSWDLETHPKGRKRDKNYRPMKG